MPIRFGATIAQLVSYPLLRDDFRFAESLGLDNAWVIDQFWIETVPDAALLEAWTTLAALAADTDRIRIGTMVTNAAVRNPGMLAKSILTVDQISDGRVEAAIGAGFYLSEHEALGIDFLNGTGRSRRLRETVAVLDQALRGATVTFEGEHSRLSGAVFRPHPTQVPRPPLWVAGQTDSSLRVAVDHADAVISLGEDGEGIDQSLRAFRARMEKLDEMCAEAGRDPATLRRCYFAGWADEPIFASSDATGDLIARYADAGATDFTFYLANPADPLLQEAVDSHRAATRDRLEQVADEVFPRFRN